MADLLDSPAALLDGSNPTLPLPPGVSPTARWVDAEQEWQASETDDAGALDGPFRSWRADGTLRTVATYRHGKRVGPAWRFHPDGSLFELGHFVGGAPRGVHRRYASAHSHVERLQSCCVPPGAWQLRQDYNPDGVAIERAWFNRDGERLLESGEPYPPRPAAVPRAAWFEESLRAWETGVVWEDGGHTGTRRRWSVDGVLQLVEDMVRGKRHGTVQSFDDTGALSWERHYVDGRLSGPSRARGFAAGTFADATACDQEGSFLDDQAVDTWSTRDQIGAVRAERDLGLPLDPQALMASPVLADERRPAAAWRELAESLLAQRRVAEALLAWARAAAAAGDPAAFRNVLVASTIPLGADAARAQSDDIVKRAGDQLVPLVDGLKRGGDPAMLLWAIGKSLHDADRASLDFVTAALLLRPDWTDPLTTRALLHGSLGDLASARADIARLSAELPEAGTTLELVLRAYFPRFDFWPARQSLDLHAGDLSAGVLPAGEPPLQPERTVDEVRDVIMRYATRLQRLRAALRARVADDAEFMLPDLSPLLSAGPVPLGRWTFTMTPEEYGGVDAWQASCQEAAADGTGDAAVSEPIEITVDETQGLSLEVTTLLTILRQARADWSALTWLCWAVGLDAPGLPDTIRSPAAFGSAAVMTMERTWRCRDKLNTSGLLALTKGIPGFEWEGSPIDLVPAALAELALGEYLEARAVFSWLCDSANRSPWQDDLRSAD